MSSKKNIISQKYRIPVPSKVNQSQTNKKTQPKKTKSKVRDEQVRAHKAWFKTIHTKFCGILGDPAREHEDTTRIFEWTHLLDKDNVVTQMEYARARSTNTFTTKPCGYLVALDVTGYDIAVNETGSDTVVRPVPRDNQIVQITKAMVKCNTDNYPVNFRTQVPVLEHVSGVQTAKKVGYEETNLFVASDPKESSNHAIGQLLNENHHRSVVSLPAGTSPHLVDNELRYLILGVYSVQISAAGLCADKSAGVLSGKIHCRNMKFAPISPGPGFVKAVQPEILIIPTRSPQITEGTVGLGAIDTVLMPPGGTTEIVSQTGGKFTADISLDGLVTNPVPDIIYALDKPIPINVATVDGGVPQEQKMTHLRMCVIGSGPPKAFIFPDVAAAKAASSSDGYLSTTSKPNNGSNKLIPVFSTGSYYFRERLADSFANCVNRAGNGKTPHVYTPMRSDVANGDLATFPVEQDSVGRPLYTIDGIVEFNPSIGVPQMKEIDMDGRG